MTAAPTPDLDPPQFRDHARNAVRQNLRAFHPLPALYPLPALALILSVGVVAGQPGPTLLVASGAFSSGFGAFQRLSRFHAAPMLLAAVCMAASTALGTAISPHLTLYVLAVGAAAFGLGLAGSFGTGPWWVLLQGTIFLVISGAQPAGLGEASARALAVLGGGLMQTLSVGLLRTLVPRGFPPLSAPNAMPPPQTPAAWRAKAREVLHIRAPEMGYAAMLGLASGAAILLERRLHVPHGYWVVITVLLVLRRGGAETLTRGGLRMAGTLVGAGAATLIAAMLRPEPMTLVALITAAAWCAYALQWVNYGTFSTSVTSYIAFLIALQGLPERAVAGERVFATLVGGLIGVAALGLAHLGGRAMRFRG